jgi:cytidine deaminase
MMKLTKEENEFIERVKKSEKYKKGGAFVLSVKNNIYHGIPFEAAVNIHGEENAIGSMITVEGMKSKFKIILIIGSPKEIIMPCGRCRVAIKRYGAKNATILCSNKSLTKIEKYTISEIYPMPCDENGFLNSAPLDSISFLSHQHYNFRHASFYTIFIYKFAEFLHNLIRRTHLNV